MKYLRTQKSSASEKTAADGCDCGAWIVFYQPSGSALMCGCVIIWQLTRVPFADARGKFIAHQSIT